MCEKPITVLIALLLLFSVFPFVVKAESFEKLPAKLQVAIFIKILAMSKEINTGQDIYIYVVQSPEVAVEFRKALGLKIGKSVLAKVLHGTGLPSDTPSAVYIGDEADMDLLMEFCRQKKVLSMTGRPGWVQRGITLSIGQADDKPKILLNISASKAEHITWNPTLFKLSKLYR